MTKPVVVRSHPACLDHLPRLGHPETPARLRTVLDALDGSGPWTVERESPLPPEEDILGALRWLHEPSYLDRFRAAVAQGEAFLDSEDCPLSPGTFRAAVAAAGVGLAAALDLVNGRLSRAFLAVRPPSHHAGRARARGFCFVNTVALVAEVVAKAWQAPVLVVDLDALHGDGTQEIFWRRGDVGVVSVHRYPGFPGTGGADEIGEGPGEGATWNLPLAAGSGDEVVNAALAALLERVVPSMRPAAVVVSAGFSGHADDPLGELAMTLDGLERAARVVVEAAEAWAGGRVISVLEGGVVPSVLGPAALAHVRALADVRVSDRFDVH